MAELKSEYGGMEIEKYIPFSRDGHEECLKVSIRCDGIISPEQVGKIAEIADEAKEKVKKIVEEF